MTLTLERVSGLREAPDDGLEQRAFDLLTRLCTQLIGAPVTIMTLDEPDARFFRSECDRSETWARLGGAPAMFSFCRETTPNGSVLVEDCASLDADAHPAIAALGIGAYAGVPLCDVEGRRVGSFVALDTVARAWSEEDLATLGEVAQFVVTKTELRRAHALVNAQADALAQSELLTRRMIDTAQDAFVSIDAHGQVTEWNGAAERMFGFTRAEVLGRPVAELIAGPGGRDREAMAAFLATGDAELGDRLFEAAAIRRDGSELPIEISVAGLKTPTGWCFNAFLHDISDRRRADRLTDQFLAMVSHELRTPLASIVAHVELLLEEDGAELPATVRRGFLDVIGRNSVRLERLVGDLLFVAQLESAHLTLSMQPVDVAEIAAHAVGAASPRARQQGIAFALHTDGPVWLSGDRDRLGQTLDNLISNAVHYSPDGGTISVRVAAAGGLAVLEVGDEGIGIPEDEQARVFDRFFRASSAAELHVQGVGLGLLIVRTIVQGHGGDISLTSRPGEGTTFRVELPIVPAHASTHQ